jgi:UDP-N-acetylglucosamine 2-epimerase (non-hydrolysing)
MGRFEDALLRVCPAVIVVAGDSEIALGGALTASKLGIPVARVGAGLRVNDWAISDEVARVVLDAIADRHYTDGPDATSTLISQGTLEHQVIEVGSTLADSVARWRASALTSAAWTSFGLRAREYVLVTIHREENVADAPHMHRVADGLVRLVGNLPVLVALHPRTRAALEATGDLDALHAAGVIISEPLDYHDFLSLELGAGAVLTDSAGVQEEATLLGVRCFTLRRATECTLTLTHGTNVLLGDDPEEISNIALTGDQEPVLPIPGWDGRAGRRIAADLVRVLAGVRSG